MEPTELLSWRSPNVKNRLVSTTSNSVPKILPHVVDKELRHRDPDEAPGRPAAQDCPDAVRV
eukprot:4364036-Pyramimonas_sp.AAC.1